MLSTRQVNFCESFAAGKTDAEAYREAYQKSSEAAARSSSSDLLGKSEIKAEIARIRALADQKAGSAVLSIIEKRMFLARVVRAAVAQLAEDSELWHSIKRTENGIEFRLPDKLAAIKADNDLAGAGSEAEANDALSDLLARVSK